MSVKEAVLPFGRFPGVDTLLGPEMRSTGEVMGIGSTFGLAFAKSQIAAGTPPADRGDGVPVARRPRQGGRPRGGADASPSSASRWLATSGTAAFLESNGVPVATVVAKVGESGAADAVELIAVGPGAAGGEHAAGPRARVPTGCTSAPPPWPTRCPVSPRWPRRVPRPPGIADWRRHGLSVVSLQEVHAVS